MPNPHDKLFRSVFGDPVHAAAHFLAFLPQEVAEQLDLSSLVARPGSFVDENLQERQTDLLFTTTFRHGDGSAFLYILFEHQSSVDPLMPLRMLRYMVRIWERFLEEDTSRRKLPPVLPMVLHHSELGWRAPVSLDELLLMPPAACTVLSSYVPHFRFLLTDLSAVPDERLWRGTFEAVVCLLFKYIRSDELPERLVAWTELLRAVALDSRTGLRALHRLVEYVLQTAGIGVEILQEATRQIHPIMPALIETTADKLRAEGQALGQTTARAELVLRILDARQVRLPDELRATILACRDRTRLDRWFDRALEAEVAADLFDEPAAQE